MCRLRGAPKQQPSPTWGRLPGSKVFTRPSPWDLLIPDLCTFAPDIPSVCVQNVISVHPRQPPSPAFNPSSEPVTSCKPVTSGSPVQPPACGLGSMKNHLLTNRSVLHPVFHLCAWLTMSLCWKTPTQPSKPGLVAVSLTSSFNPPPTLQGPRKEIKACKPSRCPEWCWRH